MSSNNFILFFYHLLISNFIICVLGPQSFVNYQRNMKAKSLLSSIFTLTILLSTLLVASSADTAYQQALFQDFQSHDLNNDNMLDTSQLLSMIKQMVNADMQIQGAQDLEFSQQFYQQAVTSSLQQFDEDHNGLDLMEFRKLIQSSMEDVAQSMPDEEIQDYNQEQQYAL